MLKLGREFFEQPTLDVASSLIGKLVVFNGIRGIITETEAYIGKDDPACHAARGKTKRNEVMFAKAGTAYVYLIYGMYNCLNFVTEAEGFPAAVLIRGLFVDGIDYKQTNGPGKLCKFLNITRQHNGIDIVNNDEFCVFDYDINPEFDITSRIGISSGKELPWRFVVNKEQMFKIAG